ncbi:MAG: sulfatase-like hydrolase/transferase [Verrucomicrobiales bacterium]|nr:sulfatase-like hydrolase/transferase [Verrucomicrobiales bacterium]
MMKSITKPSSEDARVGRGRWLSALVLGFLLSLVSLNDASGQKTDVILIIADGFGWSDPSIHQKSAIKTPNIDSIGSEGIRADRYLVTEPGTASLAAILTGKYSISSRMNEGESPSEVPGNQFRFDDSSMGKVFRKNGYRTGWFGRPYFSGESEDSGDRLGFEIFPPTGNEKAGEFQSSGQKTDVPVAVANEVERGNEAILADFEQFLTGGTDDQSDAPYLAVITPFSYRPTDLVPAGVLQSLELEIEDDGDQTEARSAVSAYEIDRTVGKLLKLIADQEVGTEPLVIFTSSGREPEENRKPWLEEHGAGIDESGTRVPFFVKGKWVASGKMIVPPIADIDLLPSLKTFCSLLKDDADQSYDGVSMAALAYGLPMRWKDRMLFQFDTESGEAGAVRTIEWRAVRAPSEGSEWRLFHMFIDPRQENDLGEQNRSEVLKLSTKLKQAYDQRQNRD